MASGSTRGRARAAGLVWVAALVWVAVHVGAIVAAADRAPPDAAPPDLAPVVRQAGEAGDGDRDESDLLTRVRQLTFEGRRAGEGYFSPDSEKLVFQSEREPGNPFYQIYVLDLTTGETRRVSPGHGKTTCAFFQPGTGDILFGSTHHDPRSEELQREELEFRASGQERRYTWDYDPEMELWVSDAGTGELTRLTDARGYDAEASYSPDGEWIVFTSIRDAYDRELDRVEQRQLQLDPAYFAEIYIMRADGSDPRRLTWAPGYDGGPFFSPDGEKIVWRRFTEDGLLADVWKMNPDGTGQERITDFDAMSWAPYTHPSGEYILFASNKLGFDNFEIYMVDFEGGKQPVRVTFTPGFDGLPVPSPTAGPWSGPPHATARRTGTAASSSSAAGTTRGPSSSWAVPRRGSATEAATPGAPGRGTRNREISNPRHPEPARRPCHTARGA